MTGRDGLRRAAHGLLIAALVYLSDERVRHFHLGWLGQITSLAYVVLVAGILVPDLRTWLLEVVDRLAAWRSDERA